jgi:hypothetical protein
VTFSTVPSSPTCTFSLSPTLAHFTHQTDLSIAWLTCRAYDPWYSCHLASALYAPLAGLSLQRSSSGVSSVTSTGGGTGKEQWKGKTNNFVTRLSNLLAHELALPVGRLVAVLGHEAWYYEGHCICGEGGCYVYCGEDALVHCELLLLTLNLKYPYWRVCY